MSDQKIELDTWKREARAAAPLDAASTRGPWFFDSYSSVHSEPLTHEYARIEATIPDGVADDDPAWATLPETLACRVPCIAGDTGTAQGRHDAAFIAAARTGWPRDAARVLALADRCAALEEALAEALDGWEGTVSDVGVTSYHTIKRLRSLLPMGPP